MNSDNLRLKQVLIRCAKLGSQGSTTVIAVGIGLAMTMIGMVMMTRSQGDVSTVSGQRATAKSLAASETGIVRLQTFIDRYRAIATYPACGDSSLLTTGTCTDTTNPSWFNPSAIPNLSASGSSSGSSGSTSCTTASPSPSPSPSPSSSPGSVSSLVASAATQNWQNIDPANLGKGQYRLIDYTYGSGVGTLTIEGRVDQQGVGRGPSTTRLEITMPITSTIGTTGAAPTAGLWAQDFGFSNSKAQVAANVLDSSGCGGSGQTSFLPTYASFSYNLPITPIPSTVPYPLSGTISTVTTKQTAFPPLPGNTYTGQLATFPPANINTKSCISSSAKTDVVYPQPGDIFTDTTGATNQGTYNSSDLPTAPSGLGTYIYRFDASCGGKSIAFSSTGGLKLGTSVNQTFILFLDGQLSTSNSGGVSGYTDGSNESTVIIYSNADIKITNGGSITAPDKLQIYNYGSNLITLTNTGDIRGFVFAPQSEVKLTNKGSMIGAVWTQRFSSSNEGGVYQSIFDDSKLQVKLGNGGSNTLGNISSWNRKPIN